MNLISQLEAVLFWKAEPLSFSVLADLLSVSEEEIKQAVSELDKLMVNRGIVLVNNGQEISLGTAPELGDLIQKLAKEELSRDIGRAGLETLTIILYRAPVSRAQIDYIRGVNSSFIIRSLLIRGLIEKVTNPNDSRSFLYRPTLELLSWLGLKKLDDLPNYEEVKQELSILP